MERLKELLESRLVSPQWRRAIGGFLVFCCLFSCKKTATSPFPADTFFKVYSVPIANGTGTLSNITFGGNIVTDDSGNTYIFYFNNLVANGGVISLLKTDKYGKMAWYKNYIPFVPYLEFSYYGICLIRIGETLYLSGKDSTQNWTMLKFNCPDGKLTGQISLGGILPPGARSGSLYISTIWQTKEGNILVNGYFTAAAGYTKPLLVMMNISGDIIWSKSDFPFHFPNSTQVNYDAENGYCMDELPDGSFLFGTVASCWIDITTVSEVETYTLNFYHISSSGSLLSTDSLAAGGHIGYFNSPTTIFLDSNVGEITEFFVFPSPQGGYIIVGEETYNLVLSNRIKVIRTDASYHVLDSSYIAPANSSLLISGIIQKTDGAILLSVYDEQLPVTNDLCNLYEIAPDISVKKIQEVGLLSQSVYMSGMTQTNDGHIVMGGLIQTNGLDTNNIFILKTDENEHY